MVMTLRPDIRTIHTLAASLAATAILAVATPGALAAPAPESPAVTSLLEALQPVTGGVVEPVVTATAGTPLAPLPPALDATIGAVVTSATDTVDPIVRPAPIVGAPLADAISAN